MTNKEKSVFIFYTIAFIISIWCGLVAGFTDSHTLPLPFLIELIVLSVGIIWFIIDMINKIMHEKSLLNLLLFIYMD